MTHLSDKPLTFEDFKQDNGITFWWASDLMVMLGYANFKSFKKVIDRATNAFISLNIIHQEHIIYEKKDGKNDYKLTRFACYLIVMNGDSKKEEIAKAQAYFVQMTRAFELSLENNEDVERLPIRDKIIEGNKSLSSVAKKSGVVSYAKFMNAGYLGMYNMATWELEQKRNVKRGKLFDHMGRMEMAANLFRITQTEERIKNKKIAGQRKLEETHKGVGSEVRKIIIENTGKKPESLPTAKPLNEVKKTLKKANTQMKKLDNKKPEINF